MWTNGRSCEKKGERGGKGREGEGQLQFLESERGEESKRERENGRSCSLQQLRPFIYHSRDVLRAWEEGGNLEGRELIVEFVELDDPFPPFLLLPLLRLPKALLHECD